MLIYTLVLIKSTNANQHLKQQGTIILPVLNLNHQPNLPKFGSLTKNCPPSTQEETDSPPKRLWIYCESGNLAFDDQSLGVYSDQFRAKGSTVDCWFY
jgi:hypothetical protein